MKIISWKKILSILIIGLLFFSHPFLLDRKSKNAFPITEETTEKETSENHIFGEKKKYNTNYTPTLKDDIKNYTIIVFNSLIGFYNTFLYKFFNLIPRPPPIIF